MTDNSTSRSPLASYVGRFVLFFAVLGVAFGVYQRLRDLVKPAWQAEGIDLTQRLRLYNDEELPLFGLDPDELAARLSASEGMDSRERFHVRRNLAVAQLRFGRLEEAVEQFESILRDLEERPSTEHQQFLKDVSSDLIGAYLRWGESLNCVGNHNYDSCLLPVQGGGVHTNTKPSLAAADLLRRRLESDPDPLDRWLLNLAHMTLGTYPDGVPAQWRIPESTFASDVDFPRFYDKGAMAGVAGNDLSGGCIVDDFDRDGDLDIVTSSMGLEDSLRYYRNEGDGSFSLRTDEAGLSEQFGGLNISSVDYDNDGFLDVLVLRGAWMGRFGDLPNSLLRNEGDGTFLDVTEEAGLLTFHGSQVGVWGDVNSDGWLDLFVGNESTEKVGLGHPCHLFLNRGDGTFVDVIEDSGIEQHAFVKGAAFGDFDNDGRTDLFVSSRDKPNALYCNIGGGDNVVRFEDKADAAGIAESFPSFACWFFDYDNDGWLDIFQAGYASGFGGEGDPALTAIAAARLGLDVDRDGLPRLYRNQGDGTFKDVAPELGLDRVVLVMGANFGDINNDGWLDIYLGTGHPDFRALMANRMFLNDSGERMLDVSTEGGFGHLQKGHAIAFGDVDLDGDQDVYAVLGGWFPADTFPNALYENPGNGNRWVTLILEGQGAPASNRLGLGARIRVDLATPSGPRSLHRVVSSGGSFGSSSYRQEIGLGDAERIERIVVQWPAGGTQEFTDVEANRHWLVKEGADELEDPHWSSFQLPSGEHKGHAGH